MSFSYKNRVVQNDLEIMTKSSLYDSFKGKTIFVAGATGMLATYIVFLLCYLRLNRGIDLKVVVLCRSKNKAEALFSDFYCENWFTILLQDICEPICYDNKVDYIFHLAGNASPYYIKNDPVGILKSNLLGTFNILEFAKHKSIRKIVFASTREVYGKNEDKDFLSETDFGTFDCLESRACYPESKRAAESIFQSYFLQYNIPFSSVRIAHSYGPGMNLYNDGRVMSDLIKNAVNKEDIILKSDGSAERAFCYLTDAVEAMFLVLLKGESGKAYNIANESEPIKIKDLAKLLSELRGVNVIFDIPKVQSNAYCNYKRSGLNVTALSNLGWTAKVNLYDGVTKTINSFLE